jgi:hypothetical protein
VIRSGAEETHWPTICAARSSNGRHQNVLTDIPRFSMHVNLSTIGGYADDTDLPPETASGIKRKARIITFTQHTALARRFKVIPRLSDGNCESLDRQFFQDLEWLLRANSGWPVNPKYAASRVRASDCFIGRLVHIPGQSGDTAQDCRAHVRRRTFGGGNRAVSLAR